MVRVEGGTFTMGDAEFRPQHKVTLSSYCIDRTEVTVVVYARCVANGDCVAAPPPSHACNGNKSDRPHNPKNCVNWDEAKTYCVSAGKRLMVDAVNARATYRYRLGAELRYPYLGFRCARGD
jgi:formylglycine-generating enzyme required for sulfatase activity